MTEDRPQRETDLTRLGDLLGGAVSGHRGGSQRESREPSRLLAEVWAEVVGQEIAANAHPLRLKDGRLVVSASSSVWAQSLQFMAEDIRTRLNARLQSESGDSEVVQSIYCRHAGWEDRDAASSSPEQGPDAAAVIDPAAETACADVAETDLGEGERTALEAVRSLELSPELSRTIERAMKAAFTRRGRPADR